MAGDLRLRMAKNLHEVADAELLLADQVQEPQTRVVAERLEESFDIEGPFRHAPNICALTYVWKGNIFV